MGLPTCHRPSTEMCPLTFPDRFCPTAPSLSCPLMQGDHSRPPSPLGTQPGEIGPAASQDTKSPCPSGATGLHSAILRYVVKGPSTLAKAHVKGCQEHFLPCLTNASSAATFTKPVTLVSPTHRASPEAAQLFQPLPSHTGTSAQGFAPAAAPRLWPSTNAEVPQHPHCRCCPSTSDSLPCQLHHRGQKGSAS